MLRGIETAILVVLVVGLGVLFYLQVTARRMKGHARKRRAQWCSLASFLLMTGFFMIQQTFHGAGPGVFSILQAIGLLIMACGVGYMVLFESITPPSEYQARLLFREDPGHCGRCEYDLTGNTTGICPECGWQLTSEPPEKSGRGKWWSHWRVKQFADWRKPLFQCCLVMLAGLVLAAIGLLVTKTLLFMSVPVVLLAGIQIARLFSCAKR